MIYEKGKWANNGLESEDIFYGVYRCIVADNNDPEKKGRLKLKCEEVYGDDVHDYWAPCKTPYAADGMGMFFIPEKGATVWCFFEKGDPRFPVWDGGTWNDETPPAGDPAIKRIKTASGIQITIDDSGKFLELKTASQTWTLDETGKKSTIVSGGLSIEMLEDPKEVKINQGDGSMLFSPSKIEADFGGKKYVLNSTGASVVAPKVSLGTLDGSQYKAVHGETNVDFISQLIDLILAATYDTPMGASGTVINTAPFLALKNQLNNMLSAKVTVD